MPTITVRYDDNGRLEKPIILGRTDTVTLEFINTDTELVDSGDCSLSLGFAEPQPITVGTWTLTYDGNSASIEARNVTSYALELMLNTIAGLESATVGNGYHAGIYTMDLPAAAAETMTLTHSILGTLTSRIVKRDSNTVVFLDLSAQKLATVSTFTALTAADLTIATITSGSGSACQHERITLTRLPQIGRLRVNINSETSTAYLRPDVSAYEVQTAFNDVSPYSAQVTRRENGESIVFDLFYNEFGAHTALTLTDTLYGPVGEYCSLALTDAVKLASMVDNAAGHEARLTLTQGTQTLLDAMVDLYPLLSATATPTIAA